jgi:hypothetical protein
VQRIEQDDGTVAYETEATEADEDLGDQGVRIDPEELAKRDADVGEEKTEL